MSLGRLIDGSSANAEQFHQLGDRVSGTEAGSGDLDAWQARVMDKDFGTKLMKGHLLAAIGGAIFGAVMIVAFALVSALTDLAGLSGIGIGVGFFLIWGGRAVWLILTQGRNAR